MPFGSGPASGETPRFPSRARSELITHGVSELLHLARTVAPLARRRRPLLRDFSPPAGARTPGARRVAQGASAAISGSVGCPGRVRPAGIDRVDGDDGARQARTPG